MDLGIAGKWALVGGASKGLGWGCARALALEGVNVVMVARGAEVLQASADKLRADGFEGNVKILTSCPSCLQGLSRYNDDAGTDADYIVVEIARHLLGENWMPQYVQRANDGGIERVLV